MAAIEGMLRLWGWLAELPLALAVEVASAVGGSASLVLG